MMEFVFGNKRISVNDEAIAAMTYEEIEAAFKGKLPYKEICRAYGKKPAPKKLEKKKKGDD